MVWRWFQEKYGNGTRVLVRDERGHTVAHFPSFDPVSASERVPNARLVAAAPKLAKALLSQLHREAGGRYHTFACRMERRGGMPGTCTEECIEARTALEEADHIEHGR